MCVQITSYFKVVVVKDDVGVSSTVWDDGLRSDLFYEGLDILVVNARKGLVRRARTSRLLLV